jgi:hypothetical protein
VSTVIKNDSGKIEMFFIWCTEEKCNNRVGSAVLDARSEIEINWAKCREHREKISNGTC